MQQLHTWFQACKEHLYVLWCDLTIYTKLCNYEQHSELQLIHFLKALIFCVEMCVQLANVWMWYAVVRRNMHKVWLRFTLLVSLRGSRMWLHSWLYSKWLLQKVTVISGYTLSKRKSYLIQNKLVATFPCMSQPALQYTRGEPGNEGSKFELMTDLEICWVKLHINGMYATIC